MTNVYATPEKKIIRTRLFEIAVETLENEGWKVERIARSGKASVRRITKGAEVKTVSIRTSQDMSVAFLRNASNTGWKTLEEVDYVVASSVDDDRNPRFAQVHLVPADDMRRRFDRAYLARQQSNYTMPADRGIWLKLYDAEAKQPAILVGGGIGLAFPAIAKVPLSREEVESLVDEPDEDVPQEKPEAPLTIAEAKRRLAAAFEVSPADIKITINA
jgi:hypothetical protein